MLWFSVSCGIKAKNLRCLSHTSNPKRAIPFGLSVRSQDIDLQCKQGFSNDEQRKAERGLVPLILDGALPPSYTGACVWAR